MEIEKRAALLRSQLNKQIGIDRFAYWFAHMMPSMVAGVFSGDWRGDDTFLDPGKEAIDALRIAGFDTAQLKGKRKADFEASCRGTFVNRFDDRNVEKTLAQNLCLLLRFGGCYSCCVKIEALLLEFKSAAQAT